MASFRTFEYDGCTFHITIHGNDELPLFSAEQLAKILSLSNVEEKLVSFDEDEVVVQEGVRYLTDMGVLRLSRDSSTPWASDLGKWAIKLVKVTTHVNHAREKRALEEELEKPKREANDFIYVVRNMSDPRPNMRKIGRTQCVEKRLSSLGTSTPEGFEVEFSIKCVDNKLCEKVVHTILGDYRVKSNKEWFLVSLDIAIACVESVVHVTNGLFRNIVEFTEGNVMAQVKDIFDELEQASTVDPEKRKRRRVSSDIRETIVADCPFTSWLRNSLEHNKDNVMRVHLHHLIDSYVDFMSSKGHVNVEKPTSKALGRKLRELGFELTSSHERQRAKNCPCGKHDRYVPSATLR